MEGRIVAIADVFDALTSERPYKRAFSVDESVSIMSEERGKHFDPDLLDIFLSLTDEVGWARPPRSLRRIRSTADATPADRMPHMA